ncbi:M96 mating-specific protein [Phytophthora megakarya]|uniref:M96 mating-specific protein n=1 Tax=Phytophthora megakarya TaxID=4795 RepID=A0A225VCW4_9STRA|nr:M96 mating-specific protein [Phytophthora megakarya]
MQARRETRHEMEAFLERLHGRSEQERKRLKAENKDYLGGERATDADFGPLHDEAAATPIRVKAVI